MSDITPHDVSKHTILGKIKNSFDYFLINMLTGSADIIDEETAIKFRHGVYPQKEDLVQKGYLINQEDEKLLFINSYCEAYEREEKKDILLQLIPWLSCNLSCDFCTFKNLVCNEEIAGEAVIRSFFSYLDRHFTNRKKIIVLSGGEPFLPGEQYEKVIKKILHEAGSRGISLRFNTNGYYLHPYIPVLRNTHIEALYLYLDFRNTPYINNRSGQEKSGFFDQVMEGIGASLENGFHTHLKILIGREDIQKLHLLAACTEKTGWLENPLFSAEIINRENFLLCGSMHALFPSPVEVVEDLYNNILKYPEILELNRPPFSVTRSLLELNQLPFPIFKSCPGGASELVFTPDGHIYPCTASITKPDESLGTFHPRAVMRTRTVESWEERDITTIKQCVDCSFQLGCGGGCTTQAKESSGKYISPFCIPVKQFMEMGLSLYFDKNLVSGE